MSAINHQLSTSEVNAILKAVPSFRGTFPCDSIPNFKRRPVALIVNTDPHYEPGEHWVAIILKTNRKAVYFDPLGFPPLIPSIQNYIAIHASSGFKYSSTTLQVPTGVACGYWCIAFIMHTSRGGSLVEFLHSFRGRSGRELQENDEKLGNWFERNKILRATS